MTLILLLDDNHDMQAMMTQVLELGGFDVLSARNGIEGLQRLEATAQLPELIICDLMMPELDGWGFLERVRSNPDWAEIPIVMMSAHSSSEDRKRAEANGVDDFLPKPFNLDTLDTVLRRFGLT